MEDDRLEGSNQTTPQGEKGVNDRLEGLNQTTPQVEKGDYEEIPTAQEDPQQQKVKEEKYKLPSFIQKLSCSGNYRKRPENN